MSIIWNRDDETISTIDKEDVEGILNCYEKSGLTYKDPYSGKAISIGANLQETMNNTIDGTDNTNAILAIKRNGTIIGYMHLYVNYGRLVLQDIVFNPDESSEQIEKLTKICITIAKQFAINDNRKLVIFCGCDNGVLNEYWLKPELDEAGFEHSADYQFDVTYFQYKPKESEKLVDGLPDLFPSKEEYKKMAEDESQKRVAEFANFLTSDTGRRIAKTLGIDLGEKTENISLGYRREKFKKRLETATSGELSPLERAKGGIEDYTTTQEAEDLRQYKKFISTSSYDDVRDAKVPPYQGEEI